MTLMTPFPDDCETAALIGQAARGDQHALETLLDRHRDRLRRMVALRLDRRLQGRIDPSDVIQEACADAAGRLPEYQRSPSMPFFLWLRFLVAQRLLDEHRKHLGAAIRDAGREISLYWAALPRSRYCPGSRSRNPHSWNDSGWRPAPRPDRTTPTSCRSSEWASAAGCTITPCSSSTATGWTPSSTRSIPCAARERVRRVQARTTEAPSPPC